MHCREFPRGAVYAKVFATDATFQPEMSWLNAEADWNMLPCLQMPSGCYRTMRYPRYSYSAARASRQFSCCPWHVTTQEWAADCTGQVLLPSSVYISEMHVGPQAIRAEVSPPPAGPRIHTRAPRAHRSRATRSSARRVDAGCKLRLSARADWLRFRSAHLRISAVHPRAAEGAEGPPAGPLVRTASGRAHGVP